MATKDPSGDKENNTCLTVVSHVCLMIIILCSQLWYSLFCVHCIKYSTLFNIIYLGLVSRTLGPLKDLKDRIHCSIWGFKLWIPTELTFIYSNAFCLTDISFRKNRWPLICECFQIKEKTLLCLFLKLPKIKQTCRVKYLLNRCTLWVYN